MSNDAINPAEIAQSTVDMSNPSGDAADQAVRLAMIMEAEAARNGLSGATGDYAGEGSLDGLPYPLEDSEDTLAMEDAEDSSDDPMHAGGLNPAPYIPAENAAMHVVDSDTYFGDESDQQRADPNFDQFAEPVEGLTDEDKTALGIDPYQD